jgi:hypothetical protein
MRVTVTVSGRKTQVQSYSKRCKIGRINWASRAETTRLTLIASLLESTRHALDELTFICNY